MAEVAPRTEPGRRIIKDLTAASDEANPGLSRVALKLATGSGKTTVLAMLIAWQTVNAVRRPGSKNFTRGFLVVTPGLTIRDRLRVLQPNDPDNSYSTRGLVPGDLLDDLNRAKIVITNFHAFKRRERVELSADTVMVSMAGIVPRGENTVKDTCYVSISAYAEKPPKSPRNRDHFWKHKIFKKTP